MTKPDRDPVAADLRRVAALPSALLRRLPQAATLVCSALDLAGARRGFWVTTSRPHWDAARSARYAVANGHEWLALCLAAENAACKLALAQRLTPGMFCESGSPWLLRGSLYDLTGGEIRPTESARIWDAYPFDLTVGEVLAHFGGELVDVDPPLSACRQAGLL